MERGQPDHGTKVVIVLVGHYYASGGVLPGTIFDHSARLPKWGKLRAYL